MIETFRGDTSSVMPEIFYQASTSFVIPEISSRESMFLNNLDPGSKIAGVTAKSLSPKKRDCLVAGMYFPSIIDF